VKLVTVVGLLHVAARGACGVQWYAEIPRLSQMQCFVEQEQAGLLPEGLQSLPLTAVV